MLRSLDCVENKMNDRLLKQSFLYTYLFGIVAHAYCFLNLTISHDSLRAFYIAAKWPKASLGRIFYSSYIALTRGKFVVPWLIGVLALFWISIVVYLIARMFQMERRVFVLLIAGICVTNPSVYATAATYLHDLDANSFAILLAVTAVWLWNQAMGKKDNKGKFVCLGVGALILSIALGIYQSFISVAITLIMLLSLKKLLDGEKAAKVLFDGFFGIGMIVVTAGLYLLEVKIFTQYTGISILDNESYNGLGNLSQAFSGNVFGKILDTYGSFVSAFKNLILTSEPVNLILLVQGILVLCIAVIAVIGIIKLDWWGRILFAVLGLFLPLGMNTSSFLSNGMYHVLMQYAVWFVYLLALLFVWWIIKEKKIPAVLKKWLGIIVLVCISLTIVENLQTSNTIYVKKNLEFQSTLSYMTRVAERMEEVEEYIPGETPVVFIGEYAVGDSMIGFEKYEVITGVEYHSPITFYDTYKDFFRYVLGRPISLEDAGNFEEHEDVLEMPAFPKEGSIAMIEGTLVVKMK